jgi:hypothetical protein
MAERDWATVGVLWNFYLAITGMILLFPGHVVAYVLLRKISPATIWGPLAGLAIAIPLNAAFWYAFSRKSSSERSTPNSLESSAIVQQMRAKCSPETIGDKSPSTFGLRGVLLAGSMSVNA